IIPPPIAPTTSVASSSSATSASALRARLPRVDESITTAPPASGTDERLRRAANDDRENIGQLLRALQQRPAGKHYLYAWGFTVLWAIVTVAIGLGMRDLFGQGLAVSAPLTLGLIAGFVLPVAFAFVLANMLTRSNELRLVGQSMAEIAIRLAEPETL